MELSLNADERELLLQILEQRHLELQKEISHTDHAISGRHFAGMRDSSSPC